MADKSNLRDYQFSFLNEKKSECFDLLNEVVN